MTATPDRIAGFFFVMFGIALLGWITPSATEVVDYGWMRPNTLPNILAWVLIGSGMVLALSKSRSAAPSFLLLGKAATYFLVIVMGLFAISKFGYVCVAPVLAMAIMLSLGERRPFWLGAGVIIVPAAIWFFIEILLARPLP